MGSEVSDQRTKATENHQQKRFPSLKRGRKKGRKMNVVKHGEPEDLLGSRREFSETLSRNFRRRHSVGEGEGALDPFWVSWCR